MRKKNIQIIIVVSVTLLILVWGFVKFKGEEIPHDFIVVEKSELVLEVSVTGRVKPAESVSLSFEKGGKISRVAAGVGERVKAGDTLVVLENGELLAELSEAQAGVESAKAALSQYQASLETQKAKFAELKRGTRPEEIRVQEVKVENAETSLANARKNLVDKLQDSYTRSDDAIRNKVDKFFNNPRSADPQISFTITDSKLEIDIEGERFQLENILVQWKTSLDELAVASDLELYTEQAKQNLVLTKSLLDKASLAVGGASPSTNITQTTIDGWATNVSTGRTNIALAVGNLTAAEEKLQTAASTLALAEQELVLKEAGTPVEQIAAQEAAVKQSEANIDSQAARIKQTEARVVAVRAQIAKTILRSPINGIITAQDAKSGEIISAGVLLVSLISDVRFEIEANVPEADIADIEVDDSARVTLDAYGGDVLFETKVTVIYPAETIVEGVATYKIILEFSKEDERIKSGMTANIDILSETRENVIAVPGRAVFSRNGEKFVRIISGGIIEEREVSVGIRGSDGDVEIVRGISEGEKVIVFFRED
ncbi:MAG: hypothetical protein BMS9Abin13_012 [Patescibacteria group bacterium]|nr:MAG: hypothetical protein BMS9Abin13_012 [Patescibacteria group bacterium]